MSKFLVSLTHAQNDTDKATVAFVVGNAAALDVYKFLKPYGKEVFEGEPMTAYRFASVLKRKTTMPDGSFPEVRHTVIGYTQRGAQPIHRRADRFRIDIAADFARDVGFARQGQGEGRHHHDADHRNAPEAGPPSQGFPGPGGQRHAHDIGDGQAHEHGSHRPGLAVRRHVPHPGADGGEAAFLAKVFQAQFLQSRLIGGGGDFSKGGGKKFG